MAIPLRGEIRTAIINVELGRRERDLISISRAEGGAYGLIQDGYGLDGRTPNRFSEWYGYDHRGGGNPPGSYGPELFGYSTADAADTDGGNRTACLLEEAEAVAEWVTPDGQWWSSTEFTVAGRSARRGWYSDTPQAGNTVAYWDGFSFRQVALCTITP